MNRKIEQVMPVNPAAVWADEAQAPVAKQKLPALKPVITMAIVGMFALLVAALGAYWWGLQTMQAAAAQTTGSQQNVADAIVQVAGAANRWALAMSLVAVFGGAGFFTLALLSCRSFQRRWLAEVAGLKQETDLRAQKLMGQLADAKVSEEESRCNLAEVKERLANISQTYLAVQRELDERRETEKSLTQHTQQLERSKDVLESHVQARTQELQRVQRRNESILNSAAEGICGFDLQGKTMFVNPAAAKYTGWKIEETAGKTEEELFFPRARRGAKDGPGFLKDEHGELLPQQLFYRKDGASFPVEYIRTPIKEGDKVVGSVVVFKDITERRQAEDKLNHKAAELARSNRELEQFAFVASHDLQEPLRKIQAFGDRLKVKCDAVKLEEGRDYLDRMQSAAARMQTLINDLLTFSRVISSAQPFVPVDLGVVTKEVLSDLECRVERMNAQVQTGKLPTVQADATQMRQLLQNLIGNALKFQSAGAVPILKIEAELLTREQVKRGKVFPQPPPVTNPADKFCLLKVQDNGIGFEEQYLEKIFAVFQRLHGRSDYEGTGVGLAVCRRIADRHGGLITAQSKPGEGATFFVLLPVQQRKPEDAT